MTSAEERPPRHTQSLEQFVFGLPRDAVHVVDRVVFYNEGEYDNDTNLFTVAYSKDFRVLVSDSDLDEDSFREVLKGTLRAEEGLRRSRVRRFEPATSGCKSCLAT